MGPGSTASRAHAAASWFLLAAASWLAPAIAGIADATPPKIDLDAFDAGKKTVLLPNSERLAYIDMGDPRGQPVVLIHGYTDNARDWVPLIPYLSRHDRLIVVDLRGHGRSAKPECCYSRYDFAYDIKLLLDALHIRHADIVGHSLGSVVTQTFAELWPERAGRLVLIASTTGPGAAEPTKPLFAYGAQIRSLKEPILPDSPFMIAWWSSPTPVDEDLIRRQRRDSAAIPLQVWLAALDQSMTFTDLLITLPQLKAPTLLIWGSKDPIFGEEDQRSLREALPAASVKIFEGLGHNPMWEQPRAVADVVNGFLDRRQ